MHALWQVDKPFGDIHALHVFKIVLCALFIFVEGFLDYDPNKKIIWKVYHVYDDTDGRVLDQGKLHHITIQGAFLLSGVVDILRNSLHTPVSYFSLSLSPSTSSFSTCTLLGEMNSTFKCIQFSPLPSSCAWCCLS